MVVDFSILLFALSLASFEVIAVEGFAVVVINTSLGLTGASSGFKVIVPLSTSRTSSSYPLPAVVHSPQSTDTAELSPLVLFSCKVVFFVSLSAFLLLFIIDDVSNLSLPRLLLSFILVIIISLLLRLSFRLGVSFALGFSLSFF